MLVNARQNRENFIFKSLFDKTYYQLDEDEYDGLLHEIACFEIINESNDICDKTGTFFGMPEGEGTYSIYRVVGSGYYGIESSDMSYEKVDMIEIIDLMDNDEYFQYNEVFLEDSSKKINTKKLYHLTNFAKYFQFCENGHVHSNNEIKVNNNQIYNPSQEEKCIKDEYIKFTYEPIIGINKESNNLKFDLNLNIPILLVFDEEITRYRNTYFDDCNNEEIFSKIPISFRYCKEIIFRSAKDKDLAINLFGENDLYEVDSNLFFQKDLREKDSYNPMDRKELNLNKHELSIILDSFEIFFGNLELADDSIIYKNKWDINHPLKRFKVIKELFENKLQLEIIIDNKLKELTLQERYKTVFKTDLFRLIGTLSNTGFDTYSSFFGHYLLNNSWDLLSKKSLDKKELFLELFNEYIDKSIKDNEVSIVDSNELRSKLTVKDIDNAIIVLKVVLFLKDSFDLNKNGVIFESLAFQTLYKLSLFKKENLDDEIIRLNDIVLLKNLSTLKYERYMLVEDINSNERNHSLDDDNEITKATPNSELGKIIYGLYIGDKVNLLGEKYKVIDIIGEEKINDIEVHLNIIDSHITEDWIRFKNTNNNQLIRSKDFKDETALKQTGYSIWDGNEMRTRDERWNILINKSIPILGLGEVAATIQSHIWNNEEKSNAVKEWKFDLRKLKNEFLKTDKVDYFD